MQANPNEKKIQLLTDEQKNNENKFHIDRSITACGGTLMFVRNATMCNGHEA